MASCWVTCALGATLFPCRQLACCGFFVLFFVLQRPALIDHTEMTHFHADDYINFLRVITPDNMHHHLRQLQRCTS